MGGKIIKGFSTLYCLNSNGELINPKSKRVLKYEIDKSGYKMYKLRREDGSKKNVKLHRLVAENFIDNPENKPYVIHKNGDILDNSFGNLEWSSLKPKPFSNRIKDLLNKIENETKKKD